ncbi:MAG TPA: response regulator [Aliidongia sp.]|nr:response regulator [Aliidongia sp.]
MSVRSGRHVPAEPEAMMERKDIVLVVDDDQAVREALKFALEVEGLSVRVCGSGMEALSHPDLTQARCLILDLRMPGMDGFDLLDRMAGMRLHLPVILITAPINAAVRRRASAAGVRHVLEKPLLDGALLDSIHDVLDHPG